MTTFSGRLFGPGLPGAGVAATASWRDDGGLSIVCDGEERSTPPPAVTAGGFNAAVLHLFWEEEGASWTLCLDDPAARERCLAASPAPLRSHLTAAAAEERKVERRFRLGWALLAGLFLLPLLALGLFFLQADRIADWAVQRIPTEQEAHLGDVVLAQVRLQSTLIESGAAVDALRAIGEPLTVGSPHHYRWFVADDAAINAFAAPGGVVVVNSGLLRAVNSPEELAGVLAHEIAHAELRHSLRAMAKSLGLRALAAIALGDFSGTAIGEAAQRLTELSYSRDAEREADHEGLRRLTAAQIDPHGMLSFFKTLEQREGVVPPAFLSTHPDTAERLANLQQEIAGLRGEWRPLAVDLAVVRAALPAR